MDNSMKRECVFPPIEYRAMLQILHEVGMRVQGAGPHTDRLRLLVQNPVEDADGLKLTVSYLDLHMLLGLAKIADGMNDVEDTVGAIGQQGWTKYNRINAAKALVDTLTEFLR